MYKSVLGLGLALLLSFSSFAAVQVVTDQGTVECADKGGKKDKKKKKSCCKKGAKQCSKSKGAASTEEEAK